MSVSKINLNPDHYRVLEQRLGFIHGLVLYDNWMICS